MNPYVCVVGAVNLDICGRPEKKLIFRDSNPGAVTLTPQSVAAARSSEQAARASLLVRFFCIVSHLLQQPMRRARRICRASGVHKRACNFTSFVLS